MIFTEAETATVLAALRHWQAALVADVEWPESYPHFDNVEPLSPVQIDDLIWKINYDDSAGTGFGR
jgi:hypothetical protein